RELLGAELDEQQRGVRVAKLGVDHVGKAGDDHRVRVAIAVLVGGQAADANLPATRRFRQVDTTRALIAAGGLPGYGLIQHLNVRAAIGGHVYRIADRVAVDVALVVLALERWPGEPNTHRRQLSVADRTHPRGIAAKLSID